MQTLTTIDFSRPDRKRFREPFDPGMLEGQMPIVELVYRDGMEFIDALAEGRGPAGELLVDTRATPARGTAMVAEVRWPDLPNRVYVRVEAQGRAEDHRLILRLDPAETLKRDFLISVACGTQTVPAQRRHRRYCVRLPLRWRRFGTRAMERGVAEDLSAGGIMITAPISQVTEGDNIVVAIPGKADLVLTATVRHIHLRSSTGELALGARFAQRAGDQARTLRRLIRTCSGRGVVLIDLS